MRVLMMNIPLRPDSFRKHFPIGLAYVVSSAKRVGYELDILDLNAHHLSDREVTNFIKNNNYDVIGLGCIVTGYPHIKRYSIHGYIHCTSQEGFTKVRMGSSGGRKSLGGGRMGEAL